MNINNILDFYNNSSTKEIAEKANSICNKFYSDKIYLRGIIEFSNYCKKNCLYCGIRSSNNYITRYRMPKEDIIQTVINGYNMGLRTIVLQSGEDCYFSTEILSEIIEEAKNATNYKIAITLSCGIKSKNEYKILKKAGADRCLLRFETSDPKLHKYLRNGASLKERLKALEDLKECDYEIGSGFMVGLPEETEQIRIENALLCKKMDFDMVGIGPFIPHHQTPLKNAKKESFDLTLRAISLVRMLLPESNIPATTASGSVDNLGREKVIKAGANVLMPNITPTKYKKHYLLYPGKICLDESGFECIDCLKNKVSLLKKEICYERGDSRSFLKRYSNSLFSYTEQNLSQIESAS